MKRIIMMLVFLVLCLSAAAADETGILGNPFPDFTVTDTQGNTFTLSEELKNHEAVLINLWATWCPPCKAEMPFLNKAYEQYGDRVAFIALSCEADDTMEKIEAYRQAQGLSFPMGRDEDASLYMYASGNGIPTTVIVDRFGNAAFVRVGSFTGIGEVKRVLEAFLGDGYTETVILNEIPKDTSTRAFPVSPVTAVLVENEDVRPLLLHAEGTSDADQIYVIHEDTAHLRLEAAASDNPAGMLCYDYRQNSFSEYPELLDPGRGVYVYDSPMSGADETPHYTYVALIDGSTGKIYAATYLIAGDEYIEELMADLRSWGYAVTWEDAESAPAEENALQAYILHIMDQDGAPVQGMMVNFCTDTACTMLQSDEKGIISFEGAPDIYHVQLLKAPEGYSFDAGFEMYTDRFYGEWALRIQKD